MERKQQAGCPAEVAGERRGRGERQARNWRTGRQTDRFCEDRESGEADGCVRWERRSGPVVDLISETMERKDTQHRHSANSAAAAAASGTKEVGAKVLRIRSIQHAASNPEQLHLFLVLF